MKPPRLLDLFCGAGGASVGYHRAGFDVVGVDIRPQPRYPFEFYQADALEFPLDGFDAIHASPPCQLYSVSTAMHDRSRHPDLIEPTRSRLVASGIVFIIENVPGAPLRNWVQVCGSGLGMRRIRRHRWFESNRALMGVPCAHGQNRDVISVVGHSEGNGRTGPGWLKGDREAAMGIDWMNRAELSQSIPPAYTEHLGRQLLTHLGVAA